MTKTDTTPNGPDAAVLSERTSQEQAARLLRHAEAQTPGAWYYSQDKQNAVFIGFDIPPGLAALCRDYIALAAERDRYREALQHVDNHCQTYNLQDAIRGGREDAEEYLDTIHEWATAALNGADDAGQR